MPTIENQHVDCLYVHVPFCARKCGYCAFYSHAADKDTVDRYLSALIAELETVAGDLRPRTIFFGGGTPSILNPRQWRQILEAFERLGLLGAEEWTVECNPATISLEKAKLLRSFGVNRISLGVQSLDEKLLDRLGRIHSREMVFQSFDILREAGFSNINLDLMFAIPSQTLAVWRSTLEEALSLGSEHLSCYEVMYEEDTVLYAQLKAGKFSVDEDLASDMYELFVERAGEVGFRQYEIANFAKSAVAEQEEVPSFACRHNVNYWRGGNFYGLGPSATSYVRGRRWKNHSNTDLYCRQMEARGNAVETREELPPLARAGETAAFGLRMVAGWPFALFRSRTGYDLRHEWSETMSGLVNRGWGIRDRGRFRLTPQGLRFADAAGAEFIR